MRYQINEIIQLTSLPATLTNSPQFDQKYTYSAIKFHLRTKKASVIILNLLSGKRKMVWEYQVEYKIKLI